MITGAQLREIEKVIGGYFIVIALPAKFSGVSNVEVTGNVEREVISFAILSIAMEVFNDQKWVARPHEPKAKAKAKKKVKAKESN